MSLVSNIQLLCDQNSISIPKLEKDLGFGKGSMYKWDKNSPSIDKVEKVADYFKVSLDYLLDRGDIYDLGDAIKEEREEQSFSAPEFANIIGISEFELLEYEANTTPLTLDLAKKIADAFGMSYFSFLDKYNLYIGYVNPEFNGDVDKQKAFDKAAFTDVINEQQNTPLPPLTVKDERSIQKRIESILNDLMPENGLAYYNGDAPMSDEDRELLRISLENTLRLAKQMAKQKFTPKKYRK